MAGAIDNFKARAGNPRVVQFAAFERDNLIVAPPRDQGRHIAQPGQQMRQRGIVHVRLPAVAGGSFAIDQLRIAIFRRGFASEEQLVVDDLLGIDEGETPRPLGTMKKDVSDLAFSRTHSHRADQD